MQPVAPFGERDGERGWVGPLRLAVLNGVVGDEPGVPAAAPSFAACRQRCTFDLS